MGNLCAGNAAAAPKGGPVEIGKVGVKKPEKMDTNLYVEPAEKV